MKGLKCPLTAVSVLLLCLPCLSVSETLRGNIGKMNEIEIFYPDDLRRVPDRLPDRVLPQPDPCCENHPGFAEPAYTEILCEEIEGFQEEVTRLKWAVRYLRAAVGSKPFEKCLRTAVDKRFHLKTSQEHDWVGPYVPCNGNDEDPQFIRDWPNPEYLAYDVVMNTAKFAGSTPNRKVELKCKPLGKNGNSMQVWPGSNSWRYDSTSNWNSAKTHKIEVNSDKLFAEYPNHAPGEDYWPDIFGIVGFVDYDNCDGASYPVDELAGMILHEMLHELKFVHEEGSGQNEDGRCGYDHYDCDDASGGETCRANALLEIAEACVSEVVELSNRNCHPELCCHRFQVPVWVENQSSIIIYGRHLAVPDDKFSLRNGLKPYDYYPSLLRGSCECESFW